MRLADNGFNLWKAIYDKLLESNLNIYPPSSHVGDCTENYIVLKPQGSVQVNDFTSQYVLFDIFIFVPDNDFTELLRYEEVVKKEAEKLYPLLVPLGDETPTVHDDTNKSYTKAISYRCIARNYRL